MSYDRRVVANWHRFLLIVGFCLLVVLSWYGNRVTTAVSSPDLNATTIYLPLIASPPIFEYDIPIANAAPRNIAVASPGNIWVTLPGVNAIGSLVVTTTVDFEFTLYPIPTPNSEPHDLVFDAANEVIWFTQQAVDQIGRFDLNTHQIDEFSLTAGSAPTGIALAPNGIVWAALRDANKLASLNPTTNNIEEIVYPTAGANFLDIAVSSTNIVWVSAPGLNRMVTYNPDNGTFVNVNLHSFGQTPFPPHAVAMNGNTPWVTAPTQNWVGVYIPGTLSLWSWYAAHPSDQGATDLVHRRLGTVNELWYVQPTDNRAGRLQINNQGQLILNQSTRLPTTNSFPEGIAVDNNGHAWITASAANAIVWWHPDAASLNQPTIQHP